MGRAAGGCAATGVVRRPSPWSTVTSSTVANDVNATYGTFATAERVASRARAKVQEQPEENKIARHRRRFADRRQGRVRGELRGGRRRAGGVRLLLQGG